MKSSVPYHDFDDGLSHKREDSSFRDPYALVFLLKKALMTTESVIINIFRVI